MKTGVIIQARTSSTRLPDKVLLPLPYGSATTVLEQVIRRVKNVVTNDCLIVATTTDPEDKKIVAIADKEGVQSFQGSKQHVLERYYLAAKHYQLDHIVRITSDCPCIDPQVMNQVIAQHLFTGADYTSNTLLNKYPHGYDCEVIAFAALEMACKNAKDPYETEHVTPYIYRSHPKKFKICKVEAPEEYHSITPRVTLDTSQDYTFLCAVYDYLYDGNRTFLIEDVFALLTRKPWLLEINSEVRQKKKFSSEKEELAEAIKLLELNEMWRAAKKLGNY